MKLFLFAQLCLMYICTLPAHAQESEDMDYNPAYLYATAQLKSDFEVFRWVLEQAHPGIYSYTPKATLNKLMDSSFQAITRPMTERDFYQLLAPIVASLHCGHTLLDPSLLYQNQGKRLPIDLYFRAGKAYIRYNYGADKGVKVPIGAEILAINGVEMSKIIAQMFPSLPADALHPQGKYQDLEEDFGNYYDLLVAQPDSFRLSCMDTKTNIASEVIIPALEDEFLREYSKRYLLEAEKGKKPLEFYTVDSLKTAVMHIRSFLDFDHKQAKQKFNRFLKQSMKTVRTQKIENLIVDVRQNSGGNLLYVNELFYQIALTPYRFLDRVEVTRNKKITELKNSDFAKASIHNPNRVIAGDSGRYFVKDSYYTDLRVREPYSYAFEGKVYLLTDKRSFSASSHLAVLFRGYKRGTIVGEETGGANSGFNAGDIINVGLPITRLQLEVPIEKCIKTIPRYPYKNRGVVPDFEVLPTIQDVLNGTDVVLRHTLDLVQKGRRK